MGVANGIPVQDCDDAPDTLRDGMLYEYGDELSGPNSLPDGYDLDYPEDSGPITIRNPPPASERTLVSAGEFHRPSPSFTHWPDPESCAPSSGRLCEAGYL